VLPLVPTISDASLITALVERWRPETSTFHLPFGEVTITLEEVVTLSCLAIDGDAVVVDIPDEEWLTICLILLGRVLLFPDRSGATVHLQYLLLIEDWQRARRFAWGAAILSYLYREMDRSVLHITHSSTSLGGGLGGWLALLQLWAWERFPHLTPRH
ncbi:unnamed protein product, partial [Linum tenue]